MDGDLGALKCDTCGRIGYAPACERVVGERCNLTIDCGGVMVRAVELDIPNRKRWASHDDD